MTMKADKRERLQAAGWRVGDAGDFLRLSPQEAAYLDCKIALGQRLRKLREQKKWSQTRLAEKIGSSQSRVAKMESCDQSVSMDLLVKSLLAVGATTTDLANAISGKE